MRFLTRSEVRTRFEGKSVAVVGSGPGCAENPPGLIDGHDIVVRVNNYKTGKGTGFRCDVFYSFFGSSVRKTAEELKADGVRLCLTKLPNASIADRLSTQETAWHRKTGKLIGIDYRPHFRRRAGWWFCDTYVPTVDEFFVGFDLLGRHQPTTGFSAILDVLSFNPREVYLTGFDGFRSGIHNVNERHIIKNRDDPIKHEPERELNWLRQNAGRFKADRRLAVLIGQRT